jgi:hypothetical protein
MFHQLDRARLTALNLPISSYYAGKRLSICLLKEEMARVFDLHAFCLYTTSCVNPLQAPICCLT